MNRKELLLLTVGIFLTAVAWLIADIRHAGTREEISIKINLPKENKYDIDKKILEILDKKINK